MNKVPKLRFKEFIDEWEEKKLENIGENIIGLTYSPNDVVESNGTLVLRSSNIKENRISLKDKVMVNLKINEKLLTKENDILICVRNGSQNLIGKNAIITKENENLTFGAFMTIFRSNYNKFIHQLFQTESYKMQILRNLGARINQITNKNLNSFVFYFPKLREQEKIADFLSNVDKKISIAEEKLELFNEYKKGIMQKIFNQELRFKDKDGNDYLEWEEKKLEDIIKYFNGSAFPEVYQGNLNEKYPFYKVGDMNSINNQKYMSDANNYISEEVKTILKCKIAPKNTIIFPKVGAALLTNKRRILTKDSIFDNNILGVKGKENEILNDNFLYFFMQTLDFAYFVQEGALPSISKNIIDKIEMLLPCLEEQQKIANFLSSIDNKIEKISDELENLKEFKKGLLQQMFV